MSRTWKDTPAKLRVAKNMKKGRINHDHKPAAARSGWRSRYDLSVTLPKGDTEAVAAHRALLASLGAHFRYTTEELKPQRIYTPPVRTEDGGYHFEPITWTPRMIRFLVEERYFLPGDDGPTCTDPADYDPITGLDRSTGRPACCTPEWTHEFWGSSLEGKNRVGRARVRAALKRAADLANSGELDEDYSDADYELEFGKKLWIWND